MSVRVFGDPRQASTRQFMSEELDEIRSRVHEVAHDTTDTRIKSLAHAISRLATIVHVFVRNHPESTKEE